MTGVSEERVQQAEDLMNELVVPSEETRAIYSFQIVTHVYYLKCTLDALILVPTV